MNRRDFIKSAGVLLAAPAIVRASSIMKVNPIIAPPPIFTESMRIGYDPGGIGTGSYIAFYHENKEKFYRIIESAGNEIIIAPEITPGSAAQTDHLLSCKSRLQIAQTLDLTQPERSPQPL